VRLIEFRQPDEALLKQLELLLDPRGKPTGDNPGEKRSKTRKDGPAPRFATLITTLADVVNQNRRDRGYCEDLTLREILHHHPEGKEILREVRVSQFDKQISKNVDIMNKKAGSAMTMEVMGFLCQGISTKEATRVFGWSKTLINDAKLQAARAEFDSSLRGPFQTLQQRPGGTKKKVADLQKVRMCTVGW
jgi:hypothetical protein